MNPKLSKKLLGIALAFTFCLAVVIVAYLFFLKNSDLISLKTPIPSFGDSFSMRVESWDPALFLTDGLSTDPRAPKWLSSGATIFKPGVTYDDFKNSVTTEYIDYYGVDQASFQKMVESVATQPALEATVFWAIHLEIKNIRYILVAKQVGLHAKVPPQDKQYIGISILKESEGKWKLYPFDSTSAFAFIPFNDLNALREIVSAGKADLGPCDLLVPVK